MGKLDGGEVAFDAGFEGEGPAGQGIEVLLVDVVGLAVVGTEGNVTGTGLKVGPIAFLQKGQPFFAEPVFPYLVEYVDEELIALSENMVELDGIGRMLLQYFALKEEGAFVVFAQQGPVLLAHHGCQLLQVADHEQLYAAKGQVAVSKAAQYPVDGIEEVGPHHAYFVDDEEVETADEVDFGSAKAEGGGRSLFFGGQVVVGHLGAKRQLKKGVDGDAAGIDGGDAGGGHYGHALGAALLQLAQKGGFAGAGLAG